MPNSKKYRDKVAKEQIYAQKLLRIKDVCNLTSLSKSYVYHLSAEGVFPKRIQLVPGGTAVAWVESEIEDWIDQRIEARDQGVDHA